MKKKKEIMNTQSGQTATKQHMVSTTLFFSQKHNQPMTKASGVDSACNLHTQDQYKFNEFREYYKRNPEGCCKKCVSKMQSIIERAKKINERKN